MQAVLNYLFWWKYENYFVIIAICFFFLSLMIRQLCTRRWGGQYFPTWGDMYWGKKKFPPGVCLFIKFFVLWSNPKSCMHCSNIFLRCNVACISRVYKQLYSNGCKLLWMKICMCVWWISFMNNEQIWWGMNFISLRFRVSFVHPFLSSSTKSSNHPILFILLK